MQPFSLILTFTFAFITSCFAQKATEIPPPEYIKTVQFEQRGTNLNGVPLIEFGSSFEVNFDDIVGDELDSNTIVQK